MHKYKILTSWTFFIAIPLFLIFHYYSGTVKTVTRIIDGDTVCFDKRHKCRLDLVDTPESQVNDKLIRDRSTCQEISENRFIEAGSLSKKFITSILPLKSNAYVHILDVDKYGRSICKITLSEEKKDISEELVSNGYAIPFFKFIASDEKDKWMDLLELAKGKNIGLWKKYPDVMNCMLNNGLHD